MGQYITVRKSITSMRAPQRRERRTKPLGPGEAAILLEGEPAALSDHAGRGVRQQLARQTGARCCAMVDPRCRHKNRSGEFSGATYEVPTFEVDRANEAVVAIREFIERFGALPNQRSWAAEKTIRNRFGSFKEAIAAALTWTESPCRFLGWSGLATDRIVV